MPRRGNVAKREVLADPIYNSKVVTRLVNYIMLDGKKGVAQEIVYDAFDIVKEKTGNDPLEMFEKAMENIMPNLECKTRRVGGANYQVPLEVSPARRETLGLRWLTAYSRARGEKTMSARLAAEIIDATNGVGGSVKKREDTHKMAEANNGLTGFHIHVCEGMNDVWDSRLNRGGISPVERLLQHNLLGPDTMLGHCIHVTPAEMDIVKESGTWLVNNPESNMGNAVGCAPVLEFFRRGIPVCMGTDAYTHDMLESLKVFLIIQRHNAAMPNVGWCEAMTMLFENNAKMASKYFDRKLGVLEAGAAADVIVMDYKPFTPLSEENIDGHMLFGMMGKNCRTTIINGRVLYKDREFVGIDEDKINAWTMAESKKLWSTLNDRVY